jgi:hypothetical protein
MTPGEIRASYRLYAAHRNSHEICDSLALSLLRLTPGIQTTSPFCCACTPALKGRRVTLATATQTTTYAPPSSGPSVICERCSHRSLSNCSVAALWWSAEATGGCSSVMRKSRSRQSLVGRLRISYGSGFGQGCADDDKLSDVLAKLDNRSLSKLLCDYKSGMLPIRLRTPWIVVRTSVSIAPVA